MSHAERLAFEANERVAGWASVTAEERTALLADLEAHIVRLRSGGAMASIRGVDRWFPSVRDAEAQIAALQNP